jgi:hypothetical protein
MTTQFLDITIVNEIMGWIGGRIFTVRFRKHNGASRTINARLDVKAYLNGGTSKLDPAQFQIVFDLTKRAYRCFDKHRVVSITADGETFAADADPCVRTPLDRGYYPPQR